jgi:hypothetical protein
VRDINQAASVSNSCLNPVSNSNTNDNMSSNGNCGGTVSQQRRSGQSSTPTTVQTANPTIEVQRQSTTQPPLTTGETCVGCFDLLNASQKSFFETLGLDDIFPRSLNITTIEQMCAYLESISGNENAIIFYKEQIFGTLLAEKVDSATA